MQDNKVCGVSITWMGNGDAKLFIADGQKVLLVCKKDALQNRLVGLFFKARSSECASYQLAQMFEEWFDKLVVSISDENERFLRHENVVGIFQLEDILSDCLLEMNLGEMTNVFGPNLTPMLMAKFAQRLGRTGTEG